MLSLLYLDICFLFSGLARKVSFILGIQNSTVNSDCPNAFYHFSDPNEVCYSALSVLTVFRACFVFFYEIPAICNSFSTNSTRHMEKRKKKKVILFLLYYSYLFIYF